MLLFGLFIDDTITKDNTAFPSRKTYYFMTLLLKSHETLNQIYEILTEVCVLNTIEDNVSICSI